jgi:hypothetical protein
MTATLCPHQLRTKLAQAFELALHRENFESDVLSLNVAKLV